MLKKSGHKGIQKRRCIIRIEYSSGTSRYLQVNKFQEKCSIFIACGNGARKDCKYYKANRL